MRHFTLALASLLLLASTASSQMRRLHSTAIVNDSRSHGVVGDNLLSLAEAMMLTNRELRIAALSPAEQNQIFGFGADIAWADIDFNVVQHIVVERELPRLRDTPHGFRIDGTNGRPVIDLRDTRGIIADSNFFDVAQVVLRGGEHGVHVTHTNSPIGSQFEDVVFEGQLVAGIRITHTTPDDLARVVVEECTFRDVPTGLIYEDIGARRSTTTVLNRTRFENCGTGIDLRLGEGGSHTMTLDRTVFTGCDEGFSMTRIGATPSRAIALQGNYLRFDGTSTGLAIEGDPTAQLRSILQNCSFAGPGTALSVAPIGSNVDLTIYESRFRGGPVVLEGGSAGKLELDNCHFDDVALTIGTSGASCTITNSTARTTSVQTSGTHNVAIDDSVFDGTGALVGTASASLDSTSNHVAGTVSIGSHVNVATPRTAAHLGTSDTSEVEPGVGTTFTLDCDLPNQLSGIWLFSFPLNFPQVAQPNDVRVWADLNFAAIVPISVRNQTSLPVPVPNTTVLVGREVMFVLVVSPDAGFSSAPPLWIPAGQRIVIR